MKFFINNNTTYNYSHYATRPRWLVEALFNESLSQKDCKINFLCFGKSSPTHKIAFAPLDQGANPRQKLKSQGKKAKTLFFTQSHLKTKNLLTGTLQTKTKNQTITSQKLKDKGLTPGLKTITANPKKIYQCLFQTKELLCWTSDLSFSNLRGYFSNILKVLQICRFAVRNNKKILFIKGNSSSCGQGKLLNPWLVQYARNTVPVTLSNLFNKSYVNPAQPLLLPQIPCLKNSKNKNQEKNGSHKIINVMKHSLPQEKGSKENSLETNQLEKHLSRLKDKNTLENKKNDQIPRRYYQLNSLLNRCLYLSFKARNIYKTSHSKNLFVFTHNSKNQEMSSQKVFPFTLRPLAKTKNEQKKTPLQEQNLKNRNQYDLSPKKIAIRIDNIIKLWVKEAEAISQQTASGLTIPLAGFLTNSKTAFNNIYSLSHYNFYDSVNSNLKSNNLFNRNICKVKINRLEKLGFQKSSHLQMSSSFGPQGVALKKKSKDGLRTNNSVKCSKYGRIFQKNTGIRQEGKPEELASNFPRTFEGLKRIASKGESKRKKQLIQYKRSNLKQFAPKNNPNSTQKKNFGQKGWWVDYSNSYNYLPLTSDTQDNIFFKNSESTIRNKKAKKPKPLEYCFFGDVFTWQFKSQKSSSMFFLNSPFSKNHDNIISYLKKQVLLEERGPIILKKKKPPFFVHFKKQYRTSKNLVLRESLQCLAHSVWQKQTRCSFLKKRQFLSALSKFIIFYLDSRNTLFKNQTKQVKKNQTYVHLPSFSTMKTKVKVMINSRFKNNKYGNKSTYGYTLVLRTFEHTPQDKMKTLQEKGHKRVFSKTFASFFTQENQKNKTLPQKKNKGLRPVLFYKYHRTIVALNNLNQHKMFAKTPFINNQLADIIFFIDPEKNQSLVNQANSLKIPTVGIVSGNMALTQGHQGYNDFSLKESVYYPILGNPTSSVFTRAVTSLIVRFLRVEKSKN